MNNFRHSHPSLNSSPRSLFPIHSPGGRFPLSTDSLSAQKNNQWQTNVETFNFEGRNAQITQRYQAPQYESFPNSQTLHSSSTLLKKDNFSHNLHKSSVPNYNSSNQGMLHCDTLPDSFLEQRVQYNAPRDTDLRTYSESQNFLPRRDNMCKSDLSSNSSLLHPHSDQEVFQRNVSDSPFWQRSSTNIMNTSSSNVFEPYDKYNSGSQNNCNSSEPKIYNERPDSKLLQDVLYRDTVNQKFPQGHPFKDHKEIADVHPKMSINSGIFETERANETAVLSQNERFSHKGPSNVFSSDMTSVSMLKNRQNDIDFRLPSDSDKPYDFPRRQMDYLADKHTSQFHSFDRITDKDTGQMQANFQAERFSNICSSVSNTLQQQSLEYLNSKQNTQNNSSLDSTLALAKTKLSDILPSLETFLTETFNKSETSLPPNVLTKHKSSFSESEYLKPYSIPFINEVTEKSNANSTDTKLEDKFKSSDYSPAEESFGEKTVNEDSFTQEADLAKSDSSCKFSTSGFDILQKSEEFSNDASSKVKSALEEAVETLVSDEPVVGLDYITEYRKNISVQGCFPFRCKLCNSAITRSSIIEHVLGFKHRLRYLKTKNEAKYDHIISLKVEKDEKDATILKAAAEMEKLYGRGKVEVIESSNEDKMNLNSAPKQNEDEENANLITLDKIPIGFEALSPEQGDDSSKNFFETFQDKDSSEARDSNFHNKSAHSVVPECSDNNEISKALNVSSCLASDFSLKDGHSHISSKLSNKDEISVDVRFLPLVNYDENASMNSKEKDDNCNAFSPCKNAGFKRCSSAVDSDDTVQKKSKICSEDNVKPKPDMKDHVISSRSSTEMKLSDVASKVQAEHNLDEQKCDKLSVYEDLLKCTISTEEEACMVMKAINILMELLLRYRLKQKPYEVVETLMKSLHSRNPEKIEEILTMLNEKTFQDAKNIKEENEKSNNDNSVSETQEQRNSEVKLTDKKEELSPVISSSSESNTLNKNCNSFNFSEGNQMLSNTTNHSQNFSIPINSNFINSSSEITVNTVSHSVAGVNQLSYSGKVADVSQSEVHSSYATLSLKPPSFFSWPKGNEASSSSVQPQTARLQDNVNTSWSSTFQPSHPQFTRLPLYPQQQNFNSTNQYSNIGQYQQFSAHYPQGRPLASNSVQIQGTAAPPPPLPSQPPPPPLPPPPPPASCNPPLPGVSCNPAFPYMPTAEQYPLSNSCQVVSGAALPPPLPLPVPTLLTSFRPPLPR